MTDAADPSPTPPDSGRPRGGRFLRDSAAIALSQYVSRAVVLIRSWVAAAALGPQGYGAWNALNLIFDYGSYTSLGALQGLDVLLPAAAATGDRGAARRLMAGALSVVVVGGVAFAIAVAGVLAWAPRQATLIDPRLAVLMTVAAFLQVAVQYFTASLRAHGRFGAVSAGQTTQAALGAGLGLLLVWPYGLWGLLVAWIAGTLVALARMCIACPEAPLAPGSPRDGWALAKVGFPIFAFFTVTLVLRSVDRMALVRFGDPHALGLYSVGLMATGLVLFVPESVAYVLFPRIAAAHQGAVDIDVVKRDVLRAQRGLAAMMPLAVGLAAIIAGPAIALLLPAYIDGVPALRMLAVGALALSVANIPSYYLLASGKQRTLLHIGVAAAVINAALVFTIASRRPEPLAVAAASSAGYVLFSLAVLGRGAAEMHDTLRSRITFVLSSMVPAAWGAVAMFGALRLIPGKGVASTLLAGTVFAIAYGPVGWAMLRGLGIRSLMRPK